LGIPLNLLYIAFDNPKISGLDLKFKWKIKNRHQVITLMPISKYCLFCVVSNANVKKNGFLNVYQYSRNPQFGKNVGSAI